ncbi:hypothetical protein PRIPAC_91818 [Pristionchus pacificus]|uniref:Uncharacterized protein n=1 Tax=Pristionchus pacificus TaxID=54126 RepID=A0A2A6CHZ6_PRIPA|nr:hypothetical protein PRIPAC_91818 [Pristionchus pacificus]|eukprot:PDM77726.1 hypothetical protein PRIPAC_34593 [Pristionchus pacificus]
MRTRWRYLATSDCFLRQISFIIGLGELVSLSETTGLAAAGGRILGDPVGRKHTVGSATLSNASLQTKVLWNGLLSNAGHNDTYRQQLWTRIIPGKLMGKRKNMYITLRRTLTFACILELHVETWYIYKHSSKREEGGICFLARLLFTPYSAATAATAARAASAFCSFLKMSSNH